MAAAGVAAAQDVDVTVQDVSPEEVTEGDEVTVDYLLNETGGEEGATDDVELEIEGIEGVVETQEDVDVTAGGEVDDVITYTTQEGDAGDDLDVTVTYDNGFDGDTDTAEGALTINEGPEEVEAGGTIDGFAVDEDGNVLNAHDFVHDTRDVPLVGSVDDDGDLTVNRLQAGGDGVYDTNPSVNVQGSVDRGAGELINETRVFLGEDKEFTLIEDIAQYDIEDFEFDGQEIRDDPVRWTLEEGNYYLAGDDDNDEFIRVREPSPDRMRVLDRNGNRIGGGSVEEDTQVQVAVDYRTGFDPADLDLQGLVLDDDERDITSEAVTVNGTNMEAEDGNEYDIVFDLDFEDTGTYEVGVEPDEDDFDTDDDEYDRDEFSSLSLLTVISEDDPNIELDQTDVYQGERVVYEVLNTFEEDSNAVFIDEGDLREDVNDIRDDNPLPADHEDALNDAMSTFRLTDEGEERGLVFEAQEDNIVNEDDYFVYAFGDLWEVDAGGDLINVGGTLGDAAQLVANEEADLEGVFAVVEKDGVAESQIRSKYLDDASVDVELFDAAEDGDHVGAIANLFEDSSSFNDDEDDDTLNVAEAEITIDSPDRTYVPGQEVDLNGTTSSGVDDVSVFVRDRDNFFHVQTISVDATDDTYEETDIDISDRTESGVTEEAADILGQPGVYRYGVIDTVDVDIAARNTGDAVTGDDGLDSSDFSSGASIQQSIRVAEPTLELDFMTFGGEVYEDDGIDWQGTLIGPEEYVVLFTDTQGGTDADTFDADSDGTIDEEGFDISDRRTGTVQATAVSPGRDGRFGDGLFSDGSVATTDRLVDLVEDDFDAIFDRSLTQDQVREILLDETVEAAGSDDLLVAEQFRLTSDSRTQINDVVPTQYEENLTGVADIEVGETAVIRGTTNRNPNDATIVVEATEGPSIAELDVGIADEWEQDGVWHVEIEVPEEVEPGNYTIQSDDGERVDEVTVDIVAEGTFAEGERLEDELGELRAQIEELQDQVAQLESERDDLQQEVNDLEDRNAELEAQLEDDDDDDEVDDEEPPEEEQPGFTAVAALIALIAVALLALRRQDE